MKVFWGDSVREVEKFEEPAGESGWGCLDLVINYRSEGVIAERHHYWGEFWSINDFILWNWGACVDTIFGHISLDACLELMRWRSAGGQVVAGLQKSCRWGSVPMGKWQNMTKSRSGDGFMPMTSADGCRWLWKAVCRWSWRKTQGLPIDSWRCTGQIMEDNLMFSIVIRVRFVYGFRVNWNSSSSLVWL